MLRLIRRERPCLEASLEFGTVFELVVKCYANGLRVLLKIGARQYVVVPEILIDICKFVHSFTKFFSCPVN